MNLSCIFQPQACVRAALVAMKTLNDQYFALLAFTRCGLLSEGIMEVGAIQNKEERNDERE